MAKKIAIFNTKGGVGKSFIAANLSVALATNQKKKVLLLDLDVTAPGDPARMLNISAQKSLADSEPSKDLLIGTSFGVDFLAGILRPQQAYQLSTEKLNAAFSFFDTLYDYFIIDAGDLFSRNFITTLEQANLLLLALSPDILSVYQIKWLLETLPSLGFPLKIAKIVLNRAESASSISWQEIKVSLPVEILASIPSQGKIAMHALNRGVPVFADSPKSRISLAIKGLSDRLKDESIYLKPVKIDQLRLKDVSFVQTPDFWGEARVVKSLEKKELPREFDEKTLLKKQIHTRLIESLNLKRLDLGVFSDPQKLEELRQRARNLVSELLAELAGSFVQQEQERKLFIKEIMDEALGLGPLEDLLNDPAITDIMVNNKDEVYIERYGKIEITNKKFISNEQVGVIIERIIAPLGRRIDESVPMVDARLADGSRVNAIIHPLSLTGPCLTIRKFGKERLTLERLKELGTLDDAIAEFLRACVFGRKNMIVSGGTGSGKTTVLNVLSSFIPDNERILTIEDAAELKLRQNHWVRLESRPPNIEGKGAITIRDLFRNSLRMRPDRIIIGECRGIESLDMLQAMNTGHDGSMTTIHANSTHDVLSRLDSMILMSGMELPIRAIREMIASAVDIIVQTARLVDGSRKVIQITEISGMRDEMHIDLHDIFVFRQTSFEEGGKILGEFKSTGIAPTFLDEIKLRGIALNENIFRE